MTSKPQLAAQVPPKPKFAAPSVPPRVGTLSTPAPGSMAAPKTGPVPRAMPTPSAPPAAYPAPTLRTPLPHTPAKAVAPSVARPASPASVAPASAAPRSVAPPSVAPPSSMAAPTFVPPARAMSRSARLDEIRDAASDFVCAESAMEGASLGLGALFGAFGCRAAMAHLLDESAAEFAVVAALGEGASAHVLSRNHMSDWALSAAAHSKRPVLLSYSEYSPEPPARHAAFGVAKKVLLVPAVSPDQRVLGVIELVDTKGVLALDKETVSTLVAFGERLGALIGSKGIRLGNLLGPQRSLPSLVDVMIPMAEDISRLTLPDCDLEDDLDQAV